VPVIGSTGSGKPGPMTLPILYSFRRCPYAMRARLSLLMRGVAVELREVVLRAKPAAMLEVSPKATVPVLVLPDQRVLVLPDQRVLDESLDIMRWATAESGAADWMSPDDAMLVADTDGAFKHHLDRYKYADRYPADAVDHRAEATRFLQRLDDRLDTRLMLGGDRLSMADIAILPFVRQFAETDRGYFDALPLPALQRWLATFLGSPLFGRAMTRFAPWQDGDAPVVFPADMSERC
jgi:glutathione S-transferase